MTVTIRTDSTHCLRVQHHASLCQRCEAVCPENAIRIEFGCVEIADSCTECGRCLSACPTGVFTLPGFDPDVFAARLVEQASRGHLTFVCPCSGCSDGVCVPCAGMLSADFLTLCALRGVRTLVLLTGDCAACSSLTETLIVETLDEIQHRLEGRLRVTHRCYSGVWKGADADGILGGIGACAVPIVDRREFFAALRSQFEDLAQSGTQTPPAEWGSRPFTEHLPDMRRLLLYACDDGAPIAFPVRSIDAACDMCQDADSLCARFCPTGALRRLSDGKTVRLVLEPSRCVDCGQCETVCPREAIFRESAERDSGIRVLISAELGACARCGRESSRLEKGLCPQCLRVERLIGAFRSLPD